MVLRCVIGVGSWCCALHESSVSSFAFHWSRLRDLACSGLPFWDLLASHCRATTELRWRLVPVLVTPGFNSSLGLFLARYFYATWRCCSPTGRSVGMAGSGDSRAKTLILSSLLDSEGLSLVLLARVLCQLAEKFPSIEVCEARPGSNGRSN